jgi:predicted small metal-binding protein
MPQLSYLAILSLNDYFNNEGGETMEKELSCRDFRSECDYTVRAASDEEILNKCHSHACSVHGKCDASPEAREKIKSRIRNV